jgi:mRNA interferase MazF
MTRGEVYWVNFDPSVGGEIRKRRPAVVLSNDVACKFLNRVQVVPVSSNVDRLYPSEAYITVKGSRRKAMADQLATVSKERFGSKVGHISAADMREIERAVLIQLGIAEMAGA